MSDEEQSNRRAAWIHEGAKRLDDHDRRIKAEAKAEVLADLKWLVDQRGIYGDVAKLHKTRFSLITQPTHIQWLYCEYTAGLMLHDMLAGENDALGWLPSWKWDEWADRSAPVPSPVPGDPND